MEIITDPKEARRILNEYLHGKKKRKWNAGRAEDLGGIFMRSAWERNYGRYLEFQKRHGVIRGWEYEPKRFFFESIKRGTNSYLPDFKVWITKCSYEWHEIKGWRYRRGEVALRRMAQFYPNEKIVVIDAKRYAEIRREVAILIPFWEGER